MRVYPVRMQEGGAAPPQPPLLDGTTLSYLKRMASLDATVAEVIGRDDSAGGLASPLHTGSSS